jgi:hypothetical protein
MLHELGRQDDPHGVYGDLGAEQELHAERSEAAYEWLAEQVPRVVDGMRVLRVRCPSGGCLLGEVYRFPLEARGERFLARSITNRVSHAGFINWAFSDDWTGPRVWYPAACRHGQAKLARAWLLDLVGLVRGWHHALETVEQARAKAPEAEQRGIARRTFHPEAPAWRPKPRRPQQVGCSSNVSRPRSNR